MDVEYVGVNPDDIDWGAAWYRFLSVVAAGFFGVFVGVQALGNLVGSRYCATQSPAPNACVDAVSALMRTFDPVVWVFSGALGAAVVIWCYEEVLVDE
jgi:hypothetical protein